MSAITSALRTSQKNGLKTILRAYTPVNTVPVRHAFWDKFTGKKGKFNFFHWIIFPSSPSNLLRCALEGMNRYSRKIRANE